MQFKNYTQKAVSYEKQMQIDENKTKVETTLERIRAHLPNAIIYNMETDSFYEKIASVIDLSSESDSFIAPKKSPQTEAQEKMMYNINHINDDAQAGVKMNFIVDMENKKYRSAAKDEDIGTCLCCLYPVNATKPILVLTDENQRLGLYALVGTPFKEGVAYLFGKEKFESFFIQLQEFHFLSLRKDPVHNYDHGLLLSYNPEWGWRNISFGIILKENQDMVRQLFDSVRTQTKPTEQPESQGMNMETVNCFCPWK